MDTPRQSFLDRLTPDLGGLDRAPGGPGLHVPASEITALARQLAREAAALLLKQRVPALWIVLVGGTGTGKSTLFNALCGANLSATGVERPKTQGPILFAPHRLGLPALLGAARDPLAPGEGEAAPERSGTVGAITVIEHDRPEWRHAVLVDTPDLDSVATANREAAEDLYLLADTVIFVSSPEKYADEVPSEFLRRILADGKPLHFVLNKVQHPLSAAELLEPLRSQGLDPSAAVIRFLPFAAHSQTEIWLAGQPAFRHLDRDLREQADGHADAATRNSLLERQRAAVSLRVERLRQLLGRERAAAAAWLEQLEARHRDACRDLLAAASQRFAEESRGYLQMEIRKLLTRYDVLARPRQWVREIVLTPLRLFGLARTPAPEDREEVLRKVREKIDLSPLHDAVMAFHRAVLQDLSPKDKDSPLFQELRQVQVPLTEAEVRQQVWHRQEELVAWLEATFQDLAHGLPKSKEWGIYSTSIAWGILIIVFEAIIGGGITVVDAALDSAIAPFVTKGAVEWFAYQEIQRVTRELAERYRNALTSVLTLQQDRYRERLQALLPSPATERKLEDLKRSLERPTAFPVAAREAE